MEPILYHLGKPVGKIISYTLTYKDGTTETKTCKDEDIVFQSFHNVVDIELVATILPKENSNEPLEK